MDIPEKSLYYTTDNIKHIMNALMEEALTDQGLRKKLESEAGAKEEIAKYLCKLPITWEKIHISFQNLPLDEEVVVDRFIGVFTGADRFEIAAGRITRCCSRPCRIAEGF